MTLAPKRLFPRLALLLAGVLGLSATISLLVIRIGTDRAAVESAARMLAAQTLAADALLESGAANAQTRLADLGLYYRDALPNLQSTRMLFLQEVQGELTDLLPDRHAQIVGPPVPEAWIAAQPPARGWIVIPLASLRGSVARSTLVAAGFALLLTLFAAAWYARRLVQPLHELAAAAPRIAAGNTVASPVGAVAEVDALVQALNQAAGAVSAAQRERELMLAGLSHDMRTPLARLAIAMELLGSHDAEIRGGMAADLGELDAILGQFIAYARDGRDETSADTNLAHVIDEAIATQQRAGREWRRNGVPGLTLRVKPLALRRALDNLFENAARHGAPPYEVELSQAHGGAVFRVRDSGPGVPAALLPELGKPFFRADGARGGHGSGLGLAIVARIAALHAGSLELRNRNAGGFEAELRIAAARTQVA
jgi:two-component system osmolarity sensor histidine kinase EnvZ